MEKLGKQTIKFDTPPTITDCASIVGPKESQGPLAKYFDQTLDDEFWGEKTWEKAESKIIKETVNTVISKSGIPSEQIDCCFAGDLLNQCISSSFGLRELNIPFFGVFGACSTFVESMSLSAIAVESFAQNVLCATSSHFCSAEKQFRFPLELGNQRPPTAQWTVTGSGAAIISKNGTGPYITHITPGKIVLFNTNWYKKRGTEEFFHHPYVNGEVAHYLVEQGVRFIGIDTINADQTGGTEFPVHDLFSEKRLMIGENWAYFDRIDFENPYIIAIPMKVVGCDGSPVRAIAVEWED